MIFRFKFARKILRKSSADFWEEGVEFCLEGTRFAHKRNFFTKPEAPRPINWKNSGQRFGSGFTGKCSHEGTGGNVTYFMAAIAYGKGGIAVKQYHERINAATISSFVCERLASIFKTRAKPRWKLFLLDGDPSQKSVKARSAWDEVGTQKFTITRRSPDLNPIEHIFHIVKQTFCKDALDRQITGKDFAVFTTRVIELFFP